MNAQDEPRRNRGRFSWVAAGVILFAIVVAAEGAWTDSIDKSDSSTPPATPVPVVSVTPTPLPR